MQRERHVREPREGDPHRSHPLRGARERDVRPCYGAHDLKLPAMRFDAVPPAITARVQAAQAEELDRWLERIFTAPTAEAVLAGVPASGIDNDV